MTKNQRLLAYVSYPPGAGAYYVRLNIPEWRYPGVPLCIRATFSGFDRRDFAEGDAVEVERVDPKDARYYRVVRLLRTVEVEKSVNITVRVPNAGAFRNAENFKGGQKMTDRVRFFVGHKYLHHNRFYPVLEEAFGLAESVARELYQRNAALDGFWIICREDQFTRFMIYRNSAGIQNGFMDLKAEIIPASGDVYQRIARKAGVSAEAAKSVLSVLNYDRATVDERLTMGSAEVDVSDNG
jgi:hypothetical protein